MATIEVRGIDHLKMILNNIEPTINAAIQAVALEIKGKIAEYPQAVTSYIRTGTLGRSWALEKGNMSAVIRNNTSYGPWVQDREQQASFHKDHGWKTTADISEEYDPKVQKLLEDTVQKALNK